MTTHPKVILKSGKDASLLRFHPWVFSGAIKKIIGTVEEGQLVEVYDNKDQFLGIGHYQKGTIAVRILSFTPVEPDKRFYADKIERAWKIRKDLGLADSESTTMYRLVHGEGDGLPGLIADVYGHTLVLQMHSVGMYLIRRLLAEAFKEVLGNRISAIYDKSESTLPYLFSLKEKDGFMEGTSDECISLESGNKFLVDIPGGQKTGFFLDQRENRQLAGKLARGKNVLNLFGYTGGFSVYALKGGANLVHTVDSSRQAVDLANRNMELNFGKDPRHTGIVADAFEYLGSAGNKYDLIILDPPAFAKHNEVLHNALQGYKRLNAKALSVIKPGGILFTFSCSQVVSRDAFRKTVFTAAAISKRQVRVLYQLSQPPDHPVNIYHPEGEYLKGLVLAVE